MCYTFNNYRQSMTDFMDAVRPSPPPKTEEGGFWNPFISLKPIETNNKCTAGYEENILNTKKVAGCGKNKGFQLIIDTHKMSELNPKDMDVKGYVALVTVPGVVTSKVPFYIDPAFNGEHNFYIHGIHVITVKKNTNYQ